MVIGNAVISRRAQNLRPKLAVGVRVVAHQHFRDISRDISTYRQAVYCVFQSNLKILVLTLIVETTFRGSLNIINFAHQRRRNSSFDRTP